MNLYFIIVIYNSRIEESITINNLLSLRKPNYILMIIDNSINGVNNDNKEFADKNELLYFTKNENMGLSKATNFAITKLNTMGLNDYDIVTPLNDDTQITLEYLSLLEENALKFEAHRGRDIYGARHGSRLSGQPVLYLSDRSAESGRRLRDLWEGHQRNGRGTIHCYRRRDGECYCGHQRSRLSGSYHQFINKVPMYERKIHRHFAYRQGPVRIRRGHRGGSADPRREHSCRVDQSELPSCVLL